MSSNKIRHYSVLLYMSWDYMPEGLMSANDSANVPKTMEWKYDLFLFYFIFCIKIESPMHQQEKLGFPHPCEELVGTCSWIMVKLLSANLHHGSWSRTMKDGFFSMVQLDRPTSMVPFLKKSIHKSFAPLTSCKPNVDQEEWPCTK